MNPPRNPEMSTPTQRPFLASFLAAFRAHSSIPQPKTSPSPTPASTQSPSTSQSHPTSHTQPRTITSSKPGATSAALSTLHSPRTHSTSPRAGPERQTEGSGAGAGRYPTRRGSDSSSEGFRDVLGKEKWYIGGRTATGEERYFKLGVVRRQRSGDRLSLDRLSL